MTQFLQFFFRRLLQNATHFWVYNILSYGIFLYVRYLFSVKRLILVLVY
jgi:hypothetical protein